MSRPASEVTGEMRLPSNSFHPGAWIDLRDGAEPVEVLSMMDVPSPLVIYRCYWAGRLITMQTFVCCGPAAPLPECCMCPVLGIGTPPHEQSTLCLSEPDCEWSR